MGTRALPLLAALLLGCTANVESQKVDFQGPDLPEGMESSFDVAEGKVLEVFTATEGRNRFVAYSVEWKGSKVIVSDTLSRSEFDVNDTIRFMVHKVNLEKPGRSMSTLGFGLLDSEDGECEKTSSELDPESSVDQTRAMKLVQGDLDAAENEADRFLALTGAAKQALQDGDKAKARSLATEFEAHTPKYRADWNYGNAVQVSNQVLGRIALGEGDVEEAKRRLLASADSDGSPQMNSFGPNMQLAKELLKENETAIVLEYFDRCGKFWSMGSSRLAAWAKTVKSGQIPNFGGNLLY